MTRQGKSTLRFALPLLLAAVYLSAPCFISRTAYAQQCNRPGFKLNYGFFSSVGHKAITADFNADGKMDIATSAYGEGKVAIYFGDGTGEFGRSFANPTAAGIS